MSDTFAHATERKVVSTLFADLVGFTALGERHDLEDLDAALRAYFAMARSVIERFGGAVEKFIGDAVVGLFGVPLAHEDDAERAVRAALEIVAQMSTLPDIGDERLRVRTAVNTGPVLVRLSAVPGAGQGALVGDAVNTAARLLSAAPDMSVVVGAETHHLTERVIDYEALPAMVAKGKADPVRRWAAVGARSRRGIDAARRDETPMIGREVELAILSGLLDRAIASGTVQTALVTGEAGIGKSRLMRELFRTLDMRPSFFCTWRQGSCPPYGDGLSYAALRQIVAGHAGIEPADPPEVAELKLVRALGDGSPDDWMMSHLRPLVGLDIAQSPRDEAFVAWSRFLENMARVRPTVIVIEDLQWASEGTLSFIGHLTGLARDVPLLLVLTCRPGAWKEREVRLPATVTRLGLKALDHNESVRLAASLGASSAAPEVVGWVADQSGGNPLFVEELTRFLDERRPDGSPGLGGDRPAAPSSILALIAARLDALPPSQRQVLADAAVAGTVFSRDLLRAASDLSAREVDDALAELCDREFVRPVEDGPRDAQDYVFWHALVRDVAYGRLTREARALKHAAMARWLDGAPEPRAGVSAVVAHHFVVAFDSSRAAGLDLLARSLAAPAVRRLLLAGDEILALDVLAAQELYRRAVDLTPADGAEKAAALARWGETLMQTGRLEQARSVLQESIDISLGGGRTRQAALALASLATLSGLVGDPDRMAVCEQAHALIADDGDTAELVTVLIESAAAGAFRGASVEALALLDQALAMSARLELPIPPRALHLRGICRFRLGLPDALDDYRRALSLAQEQGQAREAAALFYNLAEELLLVEGPTSSLKTRAAGLDFANRRHDDTAVGYLSNGLIADHFWGGRWREALAVGDGLPRLLEEQRNRVDLAYYACMISCLHALRGAAAAARDLTRLTHRHEVCAFDTDPALSMLPYLATTLLAIGDEGAARTCLEMLLHLSLAGDCPLTIALPLALRTAQAAGGTALVRDLLARATTATAFRDNAAVAGDALMQEAAGDHEQAAGSYAAAATRWLDFQVPYEHGQALLGQARSLVRLGRRRDALPPLAGARRVFTALEALPALADADRLAAGEVVGPRY